MALLMFLGFFACVFLVNGIFVYYATDTWRGLDTKDAYVKGLAYNETLARAEAQRALGWQVSVALDGDRPVLTLADRQGMPLDGLEVTGIARHPVDEHGDQALAFLAIGRGIYRTDGVLPQKGQWDLRVEVARPDAVPFLIEQRLWLK